MFRLIGEVEEVVEHRDGFVSEFSEEVLALFSSEEAGQAYIESARLRHARVEAFVGLRAFHARSLLARCASAWVEEVEDSDLELDPIF